MFGGSAFLQLPLTSDHATLKLFLDREVFGSKRFPKKISEDTAVRLRSAVGPGETNIIELNGIHVIAIVSREL